MSKRYASSLDYCGAMATAAALPQAITNASQPTIMALPTSDAPSKTKQTDGFQRFAHSYSIRNILCRILMIIYNIKLLIVKLAEDHRNW